jgi:hypothetical protein
MRTILFLILFIPLLVKGQSKFGVKTGLGYSYINNYSEKRTAPVFGLFGNFKISNTLSIQSELLINLKGFGQVINDTALYTVTSMNDTIHIRPAGNHKYYYNINYLEIPVLLRANFKGFYINSGFALSFSVYAKKKYHSYYDNNQIVFEDLENHSGIDIPFILSIGQNFTIKDQRLFIEGRATKCLLNVFNNSTSKMNNISLSIGAYF